MSKVGVVVGSIFVLLAFTPVAWPSAQGGPILQQPCGPPYSVSAMVDELEAAIDHVGLAQAADTVQVAKHHLQHVINCLEGCKGVEYKNPDSMGITSCSKELLLSPAPNPGIIPGLQGIRNAIDPDSARRNAQAALGAARAGLKKQDIKGTRAAAALVLRYLQATRAAIG